MGICAFCYIWHLFSVVVLYRSMVNWRRGWGQSAMGICAFCYMWNFCSVVVFQRSMLCLWYMCILLYVKLIWCSGFPEIYAQLGRVHLCLVYMHSSICETYLVYWFSRDLCSIGGGGYVCLWCMCILLYVKLIQCSGVP